LNESSCIEESKEESVNKGWLMSFADSLVLSPIAHSNEKSNLFSKNTPQQKKSPNHKSSD